MKSDLICNFETCSLGLVCLSVTRDGHSVDAFTASADHIGLPLFVERIDAANVGGRLIQLTADWPVNLAGVYTLRQRMGRIFASYHSLRSRRCHV